MSAYRRNVSVILIIATSVMARGVMAAPRKGGACAHSGTSCGYFADARSFVATLYPELVGKKLTISYHVMFDFDSDTQTHANELAVEVTPAPMPPIAGYILHEPSKISSPEVNLRAGFWFDKKRRIWMYTADGAWPLNSAKNKAIGELVDSHPEWTDKQVIEQLKAAGARFGPEDKEALLKQLPVENLTRFLGRLRVTTAEFHVRHQQDNGPLALLSWGVEMEAITFPAEHFSYYMVLEPFDGRVILLKRRAKP